MAWGGSRPKRKRLELHLDIDDRDHADLERLRDRTTHTSTYWFHIGLRRAINHYKHKLRTTAHVSTRTFTVRIDAELWQRARDVCNTRGVPPWQLTKKAIREALRVANDQGFDVASAANNSAS